MEIKVVSDPSKQVVGIHTKLELYIGGIGEPMVRCPLCKYEMLLNDISYIHGWKCQCKPWANLEKEYYIFPPFDISLINNSCKISWWEIILLKFVKNIEYRSEEGYYTQSKRLFNKIYILRHDKLIPKE